MAFGCLSCHNFEDFKTLLVEWFIANLAKKWEYWLNIDYQWVKCMSSPYSF